MILEIIVFISLIILSYLDIKNKTLPSPLTTSLVFVVAILNIENLAFGVLALMYGWLLMEGLADEGDFFSGLADLKMMIVLGFMVSTLSAFFFMVIAVAMIGTAYKVTMVYYFKQKGETAFLPVFLIVYSIMWGFQII